jgi:hypothetical protein
MVEMRRARELAPLLWPVVSQTARHLTKSGDEWFATQPCSSAKHFLSVLEWNVIGGQAASDDGGFLWWVDTASLCLSSSRMEAPARCVFGGRPGPRSHSPAITTTTPSIVGRRMPLPRLLTMFRPMQPATRPNRIHLKNGYGSCPFVSLMLR